MVAFVSGLTMLSVDSIGGSRSRLGSWAPLDKQTEAELARRYRAGDVVAGDQIVEACLPFVVSIAVEYRRWGVPLEDIIQQGNVGLLRALEKFDADKNCRLATYASYWIRAEIREYLVRSYRVVRLGTTKEERRALRAFRKEPVKNAEELAAVSGLSLERAQALLPILGAREASLDVSSRKDEPSLGDRLASSEASPEELAASKELRALAKTAVGDALQGLNERERLIARRRFMEDEAWTLQELGAELGVSKERVRQLEERVKGKLREKLASLPRAS